MIRHRASEWKLDAKRVGVMGFSAGGHLASTVGTHFDDGEPSANDPIDRWSCRPNIMVLGYPVITLGRFTHNGSKAALLGIRQDDEELISFLSDETQISEDTPATFIWHTRDDRAVPVENSILFAEGLRKFEVPYAFHIFESGSHGMGLAKGHREAEVWPALCEAWLKSRCFLSSQPHYSGYSTIDELFSNERTKRIIQKYLPELEFHPFFEYLKASPLLTITSFPEYSLPSEKLDTLLEELASIEQNG
ncbi:alpha/beta hydrolase [Peribacillus sp. NPDC096379]|uniref:alpha/beta hydrolase n=1 Tax=Peribacillus sp. NPDC096379 TaxID=3364393 RepID=UPI0037FB137C